MSASPGRHPPELPGFRYLSNIGSGGNAEVFLYEQERPRRQVAVKVLNAVGLTDAIRRQFTAEANAMAGLADHPNIASVFSADIAPDGRPYLVMQYYPQANLGVRARREQFSVADVLRIGVQIASAVETSHRSGILHRDIKPHNILTGKFGTPALTDFGISTVKGAGGAEGLSVPWSPPEVLYGTSEGDERSDVYSLGATLWHLLAGRSPFEVPGADNSTFVLMRRIQSEDPSRDGRADVPPSLERLLRQAMSKNPDARPQRAVDLARGLQAIEQELRLPLTQIVVPDDPGAGTAGQARPGSGFPARDTQGYGATRPRGPGDSLLGGRGAVGADDNPTKQRAPRVVSPWASSLSPSPAAPPAFGPAAFQPDATSSARTGPGPGHAAEDDPTRARGPRQFAPGPLPVRERQLPPEPWEVAGTQRRPGTLVAGATDAGAVGAGAGDGDAGSRPGSGRRRGVVLIASVVAVAAAACVVLVLHGSGGTGGQPQAQATTALGGGGGGSALGPQANAPGVPAVTGTASGGHAHFAWTYDGHAAGDTFQWRLASDPTVVHTAHGQSVTVSSAAGQAVCIEVQVVRADGLASGYAQPKCVSTGPA